MARRTTLFLLPALLVVSVAACGGEARMTTPPLTATPSSMTVVTGVSSSADTAGKRDHLDARKVTLEVFYPHTEPVWATLRGEPGATASGADITCRSTADDERILGRMRVSKADGSFQLRLDASVFPSRIRDFSESRRAWGKVECRAGGGPWVGPGETIVGME
jgi:hypothetical protein